MAAKINISVPDELQKRVTDLGISPSKLYQDAAKKVADREESLQKAREGQLPNQEEMDAIVHRLKEEKANRDESISADAEKEGIAFAQVAEYKELRRLVIQMKDEDFDQYVVDIAKDLFTGYENTNHLELYFERQLARLDLEEESIRTKMTWILGWFKGVKFFWDKLPEDLKK